MIRRDGKRDMTAAKMKLMVDQQGVTIEGDNFQLTTANAGASALAPDDVVFGVAESAQMEAIISELEAMTRRTCPASRPTSWPPGCVTSSGPVWCAVGSPRSSATPCSTS
jgi:hypothetical protein